MDEMKKKEILAKEIPKKTRKKKFRKIE